MEDRAGAFPLRVVAQDVVLALFVTVMGVQGTVALAANHAAARPLTDFGWVFFRIGASVMCVALGESVRSRRVIIATLVVMAAAITLFPALLGYLGQRIDRLRLPLGRRRPAQVSADGHLVPAAGWTRWSRLVQRHKALAATASVAVLLVLAVPFLGVHFGLPDEG